MPTPFSSHRFFADPFFYETFTKSGVTFPVVLEEEAAPGEHTRGSSPIAPRPGRWAWAQVKTVDFVVAPAPQDEWTRDKDSTTWRIDAVLASGDTYRCRMVTEQRRKGAA
jgi:hypothetical protein